MRFKCPVAVHLILIQNGKILLLKRQNTGFADNMWSVPAGCIEGNETVTQAMIREAKEEIGIAVNPVNLEVSSVLHRKDYGWESIAFFFKCSQFTGEIQNCEPQKCSELRCFSKDFLPDNLIPYVKRGIENSFEGKFFEEFGF